MNYPVKYASDSITEHTDLVLEMLQQHKELFLRDEPTLPVSLPVSYYHDQQTSTTFSYKDRDRKMINSAVCQQGTSNKHT